MTLDWTVSVTVRCISDRGAYKPPSMNMSDTAIFDLRHICKCHTLPTGRQSIATSAKMLGTELLMKNALRSMHFGGGSIEGSQ